MFFTVANLELLITENDAAAILRLAKISRFEKYAKYRRLPRELTTVIKSYYEYQWNKLGDVEEQEVKNKTAYSFFFNWFPIR